MQNTHFNLQQNNLNSVAGNINDEILRHLYSQTIKVSVAHVFASIAIIIWWSKIADSIELTIWFGMITFVTCFRLLLNTAYKNFNDTKNRHLWLHAWALSSCIMGSMYGIGFVYFTPFEQAEYAFSIGLFVAGFSVSALLAFNASKYSVVSFLSPIIILPSYFLVILGGNAGLLTCLFIIFFAVIVYLLLSNISKSFRRSIMLSFQHQQEKYKRNLLEKQLDDTNRRDGLTGLFNSRYFDERLEIEIGRAHRNHKPLCVLMVDIDYFKEYNLEYGHVAGDNCLVTIAETVQALSNRKGDLMARYGGEEIAIILPNIDSIGALAFANKLQQEIQSKRIPHKTSKINSLSYLTISIGAASLLPFTKVSPAELIHHAEKALYEAKRQGRNQVYFNGNNGLNHGTAL